MTTDTQVDKHDYKFWDVCMAKLYAERLKLMKEDKMTSSRQ